jgi:hypothetical protein
MTWRPGCPDLLHPRCAFRIPKKYSLLNAGASPNQPYLYPLLLHRFFPHFARSVEDLSTGVCTKSVENSLGPGPPPDRYRRASSRKHRTSQGGGAKYKRASGVGRRASGGGRRAAGGGRRVHHASELGAVSTRGREDETSSRRGAAKKRRRAPRSKRSRGPAMTLSSRPASQGTPTEGRD